MLKRIIKTLSKDELRNVKIFLNRTNESKKRKDIYLLDEVKRGKKEEKEICFELYDSKNPFYRLKNRLKEDIAKSLLAQHNKVSPDAEVLNKLLMAKLFISKSELSLALDYLKEAEKKAIQEYKWGVLNLIYSEQLALSQKIGAINPEEIIKNRNANAEKINKLRELDDLLAVLTYRVKISQNFRSKNDNITELLQKTIDDFSSEETLKENPEVRFKIYNSVSRLLLSENNFLSLEEYLTKTICEFEEEGLFKKNNHDTKLQMMVYLSNAQFKNGKYESSLTTAEDLLLEMREHDYIHYNKYLFYYYNALFYNYSVIDSKKALKILEEASNEEAIAKEPLNYTFILLQLCVFYFNAKDFTNCHLETKRLILNDGFEKLDVSLQQQINCLELAVLIEKNKEAVAIEKAQKVLNNTRENKALVDEYNFAQNILLLTSKKVDHLKMLKSNDKLFDYNDWLETKTN